MTTGERVAAAALSLVGMRFRLHGRDPATGLDCVGLVACSLAAAGWSGRVPGGYALRGTRAAAAAALLDHALAKAEGSAPGDVVLVETGPAQLHLLVQVAGGVVHADAGLSRVVERPGAPGWPVLGAWRWHG